MYVYTTSNSKQLFRFSPQQK